MENETGNNNETSEEDISFVVKDSGLGYYSVWTDDIIVSKIELL